MTLKGETDIRWSTQIETICKRFRAALRSGETLDSFDHLLRQVPEDVRPHRDQPFYHLFAENDETNNTDFLVELENVVLKTDCENIEMN